MAKPCDCGQAGCVARTSTDYDLGGLDVVGRMFALLHAAGCKLSDYFDMDAEQWGAGPDVNRSRSFYFHGWYSNTVIDEGGYETTHYSEGVDLI